MSHLQNVGHATTTRLLLLAGMTRKEISHAVDDGLLVRLRRGTYVETTDDVDAGYAWTGVAMARGLPLDYALSDQSALAAWGVPLVRIPRHRCHLTLDPGHRPDGQSRNVTLHTPPAAGSLLPLPAPWDDVRAVSQAVACCQVAIRVGLPGAIAAADWCLHTGVFDQQALAEASTMTNLVRNVKRAERLCQLVDPLAESVGESLLRWELAQQGVHPQAQVEFHDDEGFVGRVDFFIGTTVIEFDGDVKYGGTQGREALIREKRREDRLRALGLTVRRVVWADLNPARIQRLIASIVY